MCLLPTALKRLPYCMVAAALLHFQAVPASAQWIHVTISGTPRTPDGKPNLAAPVPTAPDGKPDLSGLWQVDSGKYLQNLAGEGVQAPLLPWAAAVYKERQSNSGTDRPSVHCLPHGVPDAMLVYPFKIVQTPGEVIVLEEEFNQYRQILTDGRALPQDPEPAWFGYSVGKWEGDTLVVEVAGFKEGSWLDDGGYPHTDALHVTERLHRLNFGTMEMNITIDDPKAYSKPWQAAPIHFKLIPDSDLIEHLCENEQDAQHLQGDH